MAKPTKAKPSFCKYCGNPIDQSTKKCTGCGKQYFRFPTIKKSTAALCAVVFISAASIAFCVYQMNQYRQEITDLKEQIADWEYLAAQKNTRIVTQDRQISDLQSDIDFINRHVVFLPDGSTEYHRYDCIIFKYLCDSFSVCDKVTANSKGYKPCALCNE